MARVAIRVAAKDYPENGIKKGQSYYFCKIKTGPRSSRTLRSLTPFKRSQLTVSSFLSSLYDIQDRLVKCDDRDEASSIKDDIESLGQDAEASFDNMPEGLQQGTSGQLLEARKNGCEEAVSELDDIISEWEDAENTWDNEIDTYKIELAEHKRTQNDYDDWEATAEEDRPEESPDVTDEPELPDNTLEDGDEYSFDASEWVDRVQGLEINTEG